MDKQKITYIGLIAIALVITIPLAYSAVEPSIIINMESGQTTKPLQVKDSGGSEVFSVDVDGTLFPEVATGSIRETLDVTVINYSNSSFTVLTSNEVFVNHLILWQIDIDDNGDPNTWTTVLVDNIFRSQSQRTSGASDCTLWIATSSDNASSWDFGGTGISTVSPSFTENPLHIDEPIVLSSGITNIGLIAHNNDGATSCDYIDFVASTSIFEVPVYTYTRVI